MKKANIKLRKCIVCQEHKTKEEWIRVVKDKEDNISIDNSGKLNGRGAYVCKDRKCIDEVIKNRLLNRHLKTKVNDNIYQELDAM